MNIENMKDLAKVRYERAVELAEEAQDLLDNVKGLKCCLIRYVNIFSLKVYYKWRLILGHKKDFSKEFTEIFFLPRNTGR